jgi:hypothetical protein
MRLPRGVREVVVPSDRGRRVADVVVTDPAGVRELPTFVATDGASVWGSALTWAGTTQCGSPGSQNPSRGLRGSPA